MSSWADEAPSCTNVLTFYHVMEGIRNVAR